jgi:hypothetical protein
MLVSALPLNHKPSFGLDLCTCVTSLYVSFPEALETKVYFNGTLNTPCFIDSKSQFPYFTF